MELPGVGALHAAFLNESRTRGLWWRPVQETRRRAGRLIAKIVERWRRGTTCILGCRASGAQTIQESMSQPFRAGLTSGSRPYGPGSDCDLLLCSHADSKAPGIAGAKAHDHFRTLPRNAEALLPSAKAEGSHQPDGLGGPVEAPACPGFPAELGGFYTLHAAFLDESRTRGC